jgi:hypothetical protein
LITEPTLQAWGLPYDFMHDDEDIPKIPKAFEMAREASRPHALLITKDMT